MLSDHAVAFVVIPALCDDATTSITSASSLVGSKAMVIGKSSISAALPLNHEASLNNSHNTILAEFYSRACALASLIDVDCNTTTLASSFTDADDVNTCFDLQPLLFECVHAPQTVSMILPFSLASIPIPALSLSVSSHFPVPDAQSIVGASPLGDGWLWKLVHDVSLVPALRPSFPLTQLVSASGSLTDECQVGLNGSGIIDPCDRPEVVLRCLNAYLFGASILLAPVGSAGGHSHQQNSFFYRSMRDRHPV